MDRSTISFSVSGFISDWLGVRDGVNPSTPAPTCSSTTRALAFVARGWGWKSLCVGHTPPGRSGSAGVIRTPRSAELTCRPTGVCPGSPTTGRRLGVRGSVSTTSTWEASQAVSVNKAANRLPWKRAVAIQWIRSSVPIRRGPGNRYFVIWGEVTQALLRCEQVNEVGPPRRTRQSHTPHMSKSISEGQRWLNE